MRTKSANWYWVDCCLLNMKLQKIKQRELRIKKVVNMEFIILWNKEKSDTQIWKKLMNLTRKRMIRSVNLSEGLSQVSGLALITSPAKAIDLNPSISSFDTSVFPIRKAKKRADKIIKEKTRALICL